MSENQAICPFCALHCDGVTLDPRGVHRGSDCRRFFKATRRLREGRPVARIGQVETSVEAATESARECLATVSVPTVIASTVDLVTARGLVELGERGRIRLVTDTTESESAVGSAFARDGRVGATLGDIRRHADLIWILGWPESTIAPLRSQLCRAETPAEVIEFSSPLTTAEAAEFSQAVHESPHARAGKSAPGRLRPIVTRFTAESESPRYFAVVIGPNAFEDDAAEAIAATLNRSLMRINASTRAVSLVVDPAATLRSVAAWRTNRPIADYRPIVETVDRKDGTNEDSLGRTFLVRMGDAPEASRVTAGLQIGGIDPGPSMSEHFLPAKICGVDNAGIAIRGDSSVTLPIDAAASPFEHRGDIGGRPDALTQLEAILATR